MKYQYVAATRRGDPSVLQVREADRHEPPAGQVRIKILAAPVCLPDVQARYGLSPYAPKTPFTPGYAIIGIVDAAGEGVSRLALGMRVAALTVFGGYSEYIYLDEKTPILMPDGLDPAEAATLILNYIVAYQVMHRAARVKPGDKVLIIGASGGIGTALLQLGKLAGLKMYGTASAGKHHVLAEYGAAPIDYRCQDFVEAMHTAEPEGLDAVFDGMGGENFQRGYSLLRRGGTVVTYGNPLSFRGMLKTIGRFVLFNLLPDGRSARLYGTSTSVFGRRPFLEDWDALFKLLQAGRIKPVIMQRFPILDASRANALLESGQVVGNLVLLAPELMVV